MELALEKEIYQHLNPYRLEEATRRTMAVGINLNLDKGLSLRVSSVQDLFWYHARDEQGGLVHAPDCYQHEWLLVQGKKQETHTGGKAKMPDHHRCTIT